MTTHQPKIVFVLGAGASAEYGLPTADALRKRVIENPPVVNASHRPDHDELLAAHMKSFADALHGSGQESIDRFVEHQPGFRHYAEIAIAHELISSTFASDRLLTDANKWYAWLFRGLFRPNRCDCSNVGIVTFNYDMTLEIALRRMRMSIKGLADYWDVGELESLKIVHVYGKLDGDPSERLLESWVGGKLSYSAHLVHKLAKGLRLTGDLRSGESTPLLDEAKSLIRGAKCVIFVGFGFDDENMKRIGTHRSFEREWTHSDKLLYLCGCGIKHEQRKDVLARIGRGVVPAYFGDHERRAGEWLRETVILSDLLDKYR
jgi:hypothetical protein